MIIPYVIDNQNHRMADVINEILSGHPGKVIRHRDSILHSRWIWVTRRQSSPFPETKKRIIERLDIRYRKLATETDLSQDVGLSAVNYLTV